MKLLDSLRIIVLWLALGAVALFITVLVAKGPLAFLISLIPAGVWDGFWGWILEAALELSLNVFWLLVYGVLLMLAFGMPKPSAQVKVPAVRRIRKATVLPAQTVSAVVSDKNIRTKQRPRSRPEHQYFAGFQLEDGNTLWLSVTSKEYPHLRKGDQGQLTFQGKTCRSFVKEGGGLYPNQ